MKHLPMFATLKFAAEHSVLKRLHSDKSDMFSDKNTTVTEGVSILS